MDLMLRQEETGGRKLYRVRRRRTLPSRDVKSGRCGLLRFLDETFASFSRLANRIRSATTVLGKKSSYPL